MAKVLDDAEFCLPPHFLTDDDFLVDKKDELGGSKPLFPYDFHSTFGFSLDLSPVDSLLCSTETETGEDDSLAGLTRQMAHSTLLNDHAFVSHNSNAWVYSSSPQSTLCTLRNGCGCEQGSIRGSFNCQSRFSSTPGTWNLLHATAGEIQRMRLHKESYGGFNNRGLLGSPARKPCQNIDFSGFYYPHQAHSHHKLQAAKLQQLKQQQLMKQQNLSASGGHKQHHFQNKGRNGKDDWTLGLSPARLQQQPHPQKGSSMRAVFLGNPIGKRQCSGTGVFLPRSRSIGSTPAESRKKTTRVFQALNLNLEEIGAPPNLHSGFNTSFTADSDVALSLGIGGSKKQRDFRPQQVISNEVRFPQEWLY
ncbi:uncharacterized protein LOC120208765 [Hibiscus syriacus]|uniref:uncharacterized protein LOC120208765 n=1 Tax=Hibiscus syriacus TaxID=106335 RepID=UPI0019222DA4|nr:uncharacterized protein LOC120208765 [Hibiscus syriacus]